MFPKPIPVFFHLQNLLSFRMTELPFLFAIGHFIDGWELLADTDDCLNSVEHAIKCGNCFIDAIDGYLISRTLN